MVNDISGGTFDSEMLPTVARLQVPIILMHIRGTPRTMQKLTDYDQSHPRNLSFSPSTNKQSFFVRNQ